MYLLLSIVDMVYAEAVEYMNSAGSVQHVRG